MRRWLVSLGTTYGVKDLEVGTASTVSLQPHAVKALIVLGAEELIGEDGQPLCSGNTSFVLSCRGASAAPYDVAAWLAFARSGLCQPCIMVLQWPLLLQCCPSKSKALCREAAHGISKHCISSRCALSLHSTGPYLYRCSRAPAASAGPYFN